MISPAQHGDQPDPGVVVDVGEDRDLLDRRPSLTGEKYRRYSVFALNRPCMARIASASAGPRGPQVRDAAVGEQDVGLPMQRIRRIGAAVTGAPSWGLATPRSAAVDTG